MIDKTNMNLSVKDASFAYKKGKTVFDGVSFSVSSGEIVALLGANGCGKTTLLRCIMGFEKLCGGTVTLDGENVYSVPERSLWQKIAYVPQARRFEASIDVMNMILLGCAGRVGVFSSPGEREYSLCESITDKLGISHLRDKKCSEISGGELQMVLIARALAAEPGILILDEPESNLDFKNQLTVLGTLSSLRKEGISCIMTTHYPDHALMTADKALLFTPDGALFGNTEEIVTRENISSAFGVDAVIGEYTDRGERYRAVIPVRISEK